MAIYLVSFISSKIYIETNIGEVLDKDYNIFVNNNDNIPTESKTRENCRFISYSLKIRKPFILIRNIQIERVSVELYINEYTFYNQLDGEVKSLGRHFVSDNRMNYSEGINIYIDELTEDKLKEFMKDYIIIVTWKDLINKQHKQLYRIIDYLE